MIHIYKFQGNEAIPKKNLESTIIRNQKVHKEKGLSFHSYPSTFLIHQYIVIIKNIFNLYNKTLR